jgi:hypothetical protein
MGFRYRIDDKESVEIVQGEDRTLTIRIMDENYNPVNLSDATEVKLQMPKQDGVGVVTRSSLQHSIDPDSVSVQENHISIPDHGLVENDLVQFSGDDLPSGLTALTDYYVKVADKDTIQVLDAPDGELITLADAGTGTHTLEFAPLEVDSTTQLGKMVVTLSDAACLALKAGEKQSMELEYTIDGVTRIVQMPRSLTVFEQSL